MNKLTSSPFLALAVVAALGMGLTGCGGGGSDSADTPTVEPGPTPEEQIAALQQRIADLEEQLGLEPGGDIGGSIDALESRIAQLQGQLDAKEKEAADAKQKADDAAAAAAAKAMEATAAKLYAGIGETPLAGRSASHGDGANAGKLVVSITTDGSPVETPLSEDKKTSIDALHGWDGKKYMASGATVDGTYEAVVYSDVGEPTEGDPFNEVYTDIEAASGERPITSDDATNSGRVASPSFDQSAGKKEFKKGKNLERVIIPGSYHGVSGTYYCTPSGGDTHCSATVATKGFTLQGGTWKFKPSNPEANVMSTPDTDYASYGFWLHKPAKGDWVATAFSTDKGSVDDATGIDTLNGTATYMGGAAGKYALSSSTGGINDAGHFTARATLNADFNDDQVTGTIDRFIGADGESRDWSVELKKSGVNAGGTILGADGTGDQMQTVWTIDGSAADPAGGWQGLLQDNGDDLVPQVATGTFHTEYGTAGSMVGAFGANKQ